MSMYQVTGLGQVPDSAASMPEPIAIISDPMAQLRIAYARVREMCEDQIGVDFCNSILPQTPILQEPGLTSKWYFWAGLGFLAGKIL